MSQEIAKDGMVGNIPVNPELSKKLELINDAEDIQKLRENAEEQFNIDKLKEKYKQILLQSKEFTGNNDLKEEDADLAVQRYMDNFYVFQPAEDNFSTKLAKIYVRRRKLGRKYGVPFVSFAALAGIVYAGILGISAVQVKNAEKNVEVAVEESYRSSLNLENQIKDLNSQKNILTDSDELTELIRSAEESLRGTQEFYDSYCSEGTATDDINKNNYSEAKQKLSAVNQVLSTVEGKINKGRGFVRLEQDLVSTRQGLDSLIQEIKSSNPPTVLLTKAESVYNSGIANISNRQLQEGIKYKQQLFSIKSDVKEFELLPARLKQVYESVKIVSDDPEANPQAEDLYFKGQNYVNSVDIASLKNVIASLESLDALLKQEFEIRIVSRPGFLSGVDMYFNAPRHPDYLSEEEKRRYFSGYHLFVEAYDSNNRKVPQMITSSETQKTKEVTIWGEKIPGEYGSSEVWTRIVADKKKDGIVNENIFGRKRAGRLKPEVTLNGVTQRIGQIFYEE